MNWNESLELMKQGEVVESLVSYTQYEINEDGQLLAECSPVKEDYVVKEEKEGEFKVAKLVYENSSDEDISEFLGRTYKHALFMRKHEDVKRANMLN